jgi:hypothetical protein
MITIPKNAIHIEDAEVTVYKIGTAAKRLASLNETRKKHPDLAAMLEERTAGGGDDKAVLSITYLLANGVQDSAEWYVRLGDLRAFKDDAFDHRVGDLDNENVEFSFKIKPERALWFLVDVGHHVPANSILLTSEIVGMDLARADGYDPPEYKRLGPR